MSAMWSDIYATLGMNKLAYIEQCILSEHLTFCERLYAGDALVFGTTPQKLSKILTTLEKRSANICLASQLR